MPTDAAGLRTYWFGGTEFSGDWFKTQVDLAVAALDERYNPDDHVYVRLESLFEFIIRHPKAREKLRDYFEAIKKIDFPDPRTAERRANPARRASKKIG